MDFLGFYGMDANWIWIIILPLTAWLVYYFIKKDKKARNAKTEREAAFEEQKRQEKDNEQKYDSPERSSKSQQSNN